MPRQPAEHSFDFTVDTEQLFVHSSYRTFVRSSGSTSFSVTPHQETVHMAAIIDIRTGEGLAEQLSAHDLALAGFGPRRNASRANSPQLRVIHGGKSAVAQQRRQVFLLRRALVLVVLSTAVLGAGLLLRSGFSAATSEQSMSTSATQGGVIQGGAASLIDSSVPYFVQSGDSLWTLAERVSPQEDPRDVVDQILELNAGIDGFSSDAPLRVGQTLRLPASSNS
ncbi:MAG: LysM peptidoglycan-binding domain-containing protein [Actinobacteria bacterium]|nr:LysM peptidoglycan-binding domain-containing protein [Actinomycetota bacterium]MSV84813.1 LysM peptidoglycan-binding domain-containing protein [Actinomycetota bacterium]MSX75158.1 LysM peptidoglycan-binding domain-containing protein [Actinomycetota bacterium]MSY22259.1 LysM peptidoglycan-binding domain-containing protein [Actinomycetota bacterium]MTA74294.1 LysM peptidoglycan-binding domain-containing protein [Actinomycetota bacterium]